VQGVELQKSGNWSQSSNATITANAYSTGTFNPHQQVPLQAELV
jgi:hypothetical protein